MKEPIKQYKPVEKLELPKIKKEFPKVFKKVHCPSCSEVVGVENITLEKSLAKCSGCEVIFSIEKEVASLKAKTTMKQEIFRPEGIDMFFYKDDLEISIEPHIGVIDAFCGFLFPFVTAFSIFVYFDKGISIYIPLLLTVGSIFFLYRILNNHKNKTYIDVNDHSLTLKHRPKNLKKDKRFLVEDIDQVYLKKAADQPGYFTLHLIVNGPNGQQHQKLLTVNSISKAKYLEQEIEKYLGIEDRKVPEADV